MDFLGDKTNLMAMVLLVATVIIFLRWSQRNIRASAQRIKKYQGIPEADAAPAHNLDAPANVARWEIQMHDLSRDLSGQLDSKITIINSLLRTAEEHIERLESAILQAEKLKIVESDENAGKERNTES